MLEIHLQEVVVAQLASLDIRHFPLQLAAAIHARSTNALSNNHLANPACGQHPLNNHF